VADVRGVLVTHRHWDHLGLAERVRQASSAWVAMHPADASTVASWVHRGPAANVAAEVAFLVSLGADRGEAASDVGSPESFSEFHPLPIPDRFLEDGELADFPGWRMRAVHTPGHTPGHLCFAEDRTGLFFSGDHVLPRISPNISTTFDGTADPLGDYMRSLTAVSASEPAEVLPAHEWRFRGLAERAGELTKHHEHRLAELLDAIRTHPGSTAWDLAAYLTWSRPWERYERRMRIFAVTETDAHLRLLATRGLIIHSGDPVRKWTVAVR
jgi:glyoxylase-like metal-dependent hydrolase (beta-lactamase superfamily II)